MTRLEGINITLKNVEKLLEDIISGKINDMYNDIAEDVNKLNKLKPTESRKKMLPIFWQLEKVFLDPKVDDKIDDKVDNEADDEVDSTDMLPLEDGKSAAERQQKGQGLKILTPQQITRLPILLAQLKAGNNSQKLKNETRQFLDLFYRSKNLSKTIYNSSMNTI